MLDAKADANQKDIIAGARRCGISVVSLHRVGQGVPDLLVGFQGTTYLAEVKSPEGKLTRSQIAWLDGWRGQAGVVRSLEDLLRMVGYEG